MKIPTLVCCGDRWHPEATVRTGLEALGVSATYDFDWMTDAPDPRTEAWSEYPLVVLGKSNHVSVHDHRPWITPAMETSLRDHIGRGNGLVVIHSGAAGYADQPAMRALAGGAFTHHPPLCEVRIDATASHPLTDGVRNFTITDEHYFVTLDDPLATIFLHGRSQHGVQPAGWTRSEGAGRVCVLTPGHNPEVWRHPDFQLLLRHALRWASGRMIKSP